MNKYIILSVNDDPKYLFWVPLTVWAWQQFGWEPHVFFRGTTTDLFANGALRLAVHYWNIATNRLTQDQLHLVNRIDGYQDETITQCSRLYGACVVDGYLMTGDIDMIPLSDYWKPDQNKLTVYGRDLTDYHYPICYIGMDATKWLEVMQIDGNDYQYYMQRDLMTMPQAKSQDKVKRWVTDQDLITERINSSSFVPHRIDRGTDRKTGYPIGRVDRSHWTLKHNVFIDAHLPHDVLTNEISFKNVLELLHFNWPGEDFKWFVTYYKEFKKLCQK